MIMTLLRCSRFCPSPESRVGSTSPHHEITPHCKHEPSNNLLESFFQPTSSAHKKGGFGILRGPRHLQGTPSAQVASTRRWLLLHFVDPSYHKLRSFAGPTCETLAVAKYVTLSIVNKVPYLSAPTVVLPSLVFCYETFRIKTGFAVRESRFKTCTDHINRLLSPSSSPSTATSNLKVTKH